MTNGLDIEAMGLSEEPIEGLDEAFEQWQPDSDLPPTRPGKHQASVREIQDQEVRNDNLFLTLGFDLKGGEEDGEQFNFVRLDSFLRKGMDGVVRSGILNMVKSSGIEGKATSLKELAELVNHLIATGRTTNFKTGLETYCKDCAADKRMEITGCESDEDAKVAMQAMENTEENKYARSRAYRDVAKAARKHTTSGIPKRADGRHVPTVECPVHHTELKVRPVIVQWLKPSDGGGSEI